MAEIRQYRDELQDLYKLWFRTSKNIPYTEKLDAGAFERAFLENAMSENVCFLAHEGGKPEGAAMAHLYPGWGAVLQMWCAHEDLGDEKSVLLLDRCIELCRERNVPKISPKPLLGSRGYYEFFKGRGFIINEEYPEGLWMRKILDVIPEFDMPKDLAINFTDDLDNSGAIESVARLDVEIAQEQLDLDADVEKNIQSLRDEMREADVMYGIAKINSEFAGYSRIGFTDLISGEKMASNRGLAVKDCFRNRKIGEALLLSSMKAVRNQGYGEMYISTHSKNPARRLYERVGFDTIETVPSLVLMIG
jgi:ribosomal protein S18 acetylase RimI-like enzyme